MTLPWSYVNRMGSEIYYDIIIFFNKKSLKIMLKLKKKSLLQYTYLSMLNVVMPHDLTWLRK